MSKTPPKKKDLCVIVHREWDGALVSEVCNRAESPGSLVIRGSIVIDRPSKRGPIDNRTLINRAKALANLLGLPYVEDMTWQCQAMKKSRCYCPDCIAAGRG